MNEIFNDIELYQVSWCVNANAICILYAQIVMQCHYEIDLLTDEFENDKTRIVATRER